MSNTTAFFLVYFGAVGGCALCFGSLWLVAWWQGRRDRKWAETRLVSLWPTRPRIRIPHRFE